ncbi:MAG: fasciclin domain-containing protein [Bacteroidota bacterium]
MKLFKISFLVCAAALLISSCKKEEATVTLPDLDAYLKTQSNLSTFNAAIDKAQLSDYKKGPGPFSWLAPTNDAFTAAGITADSLNRMTQGAASYLVMYHILSSTSNPPTAVLTNEMIAQFSVSRATQLGGTLAFMGQKGNDFFVNGSRITSKDNRLSNGVLHVIDRVNTPPQLRGNIQSILQRTGQHNLFIALLNRASQWAQLSAGTFTVLAPTDAAITALGAPFNSTPTINTIPVTDATRIVRFHMFSGARLFNNDFKDGLTPSTMQGPGRSIRVTSNGAGLAGPLNTAPVQFGGTLRDVLGTNGVVHSLNGVLLPGN